MVFKERQSRIKGVIEEDRLLELHLYPGNICNRDCSFCTVLGSPKGWYSEYTTQHLDAVLKAVCLHENAVIKFYGGEPTLNPENVIWAINYLRERGYQGAFVIYSNGIQAERLLQILESDSLGKTTASLNYSITTGDGAPQMPKRSLQLLETYETEQDNAIALGHPAVLHSGRGIEAFTGETTRPQASSKCPHCYPVLTTQGKFHACPFAVENKAPHFQLGELQTSPAHISKNFTTFLNWLDTVHEPFAVEHSLPACTVCRKHLQELPVPAFEGKP
jgi:hypothetical protein